MTDVEENLIPWGFELEEYIRLGEPFVVQLDEAFFENLLYDSSHELKNRYMHLDWKTEQFAEQDKVCSSRKNEQVTEQVTERVKKLLLVLGDNESSAAELMSRLKIKHRPTFMQNCLHPAIDARLVELTIPEKPNSRLQKYRRA